MKRQAIIVGAAVLFAISPVLCTPVLGDFVVGWGSCEALKAEVAQLRVDMAR